MSRSSYVYITADEERNLTIGVAKDLDVALALDQELAGKPLKVVYFEECSTILEAHQRSNAFTRMSRRRRAKLVSKHNPKWKSLVPGVQWVGPAGGSVDFLEDFGEEPFDDFGNSTGGVPARIPVGPLGPREGAAACALPVSE